MQQAKPCRYDRGIAAFFIWKRGSLLFKDLLAVTRHGSRWRPAKTVLQPYSRCYQVVIWSLSSKLSILFRRSHVSLQAPRPTSCKSILLHVLYIVFAGSWVFLHKPFNHGVLHLVTACAHALRTTEIPHSDIVTPDRASEKSAKLFFLPVVYEFQCFSSVRICWDAYRVHVCTCASQCVFGTRDWRYAQICSTAYLKFKQLFQGAYCVFASAYGPCYHFIIFSHHKFHNPIIIFPEVAGLRLKLQIFMQNKMVCQHTASRADSRLYQYTHKCMYMYTWCIYIYIYYMYMFM